MRNTSLRRLIGFAYGVHSSQVVGGPVTLDMRYDIEASAGLAPGDPRANDRTIYRALIRDLFATRFDLTLRVHSTGASQCASGC